MGENIFAMTPEEFDSRFVPEETEILFLTVKSAGGAAVIGGGLLKPSMEFVASVDLTTGKCSKEKGRLEWIIRDDKNRKGWGFPFKAYNIYHIRGRKCIPTKLAPNQLKTLNNCYMVTQWLNDGVTDPRLEKLKEKYLAPVLIEDAAIGTFTLDRKFSWFEGRIDWCGYPCTVMLETDRDGGKTAKKAFAHLQELFADCMAWDEKFRKFAVSELMDILDDWKMTDEEITEEQFAEMLRLSELTISPRGELTAYYNEDEDLFGGHSIEISATMKGKMESANLVG